MYNINSKSSIMKTKFLTISIFIIFSFSCSDDEISTQLVNVQLSNTSDVIFENTTFHGVSFGDINPGETTEYQELKNVYENSIVSIIINGNAYGWTPTDFVGETPLNKGNYTVEFTFDTLSETLTHEFIKD